MLPMSADLCSSSCDQQQQSRGQSCDAADDAMLGKEGKEISAESETFCILGQFEKLYKNRLAEVEAGADATSAQVTELKLKIMTDWVEDLGEQNKMLIRTVHELEQAAISKVKLLENKLQETQNMSHSDKSEEDLNDLTNRTSLLLQDQNDMQQKIDYLQNDVRNLLKLIKRGREENNWDLDGMQFCSIQLSDIPAPMNCSCCQDKNITEVDQDCFSLTNEVVQKNNLIFDLKNIIVNYEKKIEDLMDNCHFKSYIIWELKNRLKSELKKNDKASTAAKTVRISTETYQQLEDTTADNLIDSPAKQMDDYESLLLLRDNEIRKLKTILDEKSTEAVNQTDKSSTFNVTPEYETQARSDSVDTADLMKGNAILKLKIENESILELLKNIESTYEMNMTIANEKFQDLKDYLCNYKSNVAEQNVYNSTKEFIGGVEMKIFNIQYLFQNNCEMCAKENLLSKLKQIMLKVSSGICTLSEIYENKDKTSATKMVTEKGAIDSKNKTTEFEQKAICAALLQQFRMMEEFRICTVEVQAATEDLREEMSVVIANLNIRHSKYVELNQMVNQVQDYLSKTRENICEVINRLELQDQERIRHNERITNNRIRLKDMKNEFNQTQSELSKCLNNVHNNIQQTNLLGYAEIHSCNNLLVSLVEEVEQVVNNLHNLRTQDCCTLSTMNELRKQLTVTENNIKELKRKSDQVLIENEAAEKYFKERSKYFEKYECEVDNCHTKMQDILEGIISTRNQMNKFGCLKETTNCFQTSNETIKLKEDLRRLHKEYEELKLKIIQESHNSVQDKVESSLENRVIELQDEIKLLKTEIKFKQEANEFLKENIDTLEKEIDSFRTKADNYRKCSSSECLELKKKILEFEDCLKVQKDTENNLKCLVNNEMESKKSQFFDYVNKDQFYDSTLLGLQSENIPQLLKALQRNIQLIKCGLQEVSDDLKKLIAEDSSLTPSSAHSIKTAIDILTKYVKYVNYCSSELEKVQICLCSKDKLMENMDEIIRIQKDSISITQSEVENLHKTSQEKINLQGKTISQYEQEKKQLNKQIELQVQTINHLQDAVVEAKRTIDQLNKKAASDSVNKSQIIRSLSLYLDETEMQYRNCFGEASKQSALLELQRDSISTLQRKIHSLEYNKLLNAFTLHFIYYLMLFKYQELEDQRQRICDMKLKINELLDLKNIYEQDSSEMQYKYQKAIEEMKQLKISSEDSWRKVLSEKQIQIEKLINENNDFKRQFQVYNLDFNLIQEEMRKMGITKPSFGRFKAKIEIMRSENKRFRCDIEHYQQTISNLKFDNECLKMELQDLTCNNSEIYKETKHFLSTEIIPKNEKINCIINDPANTKLKDENQILKKSNDILKARIDTLEQQSEDHKYALEYQLSNTKYQLLEIQRNYDRLLQELYRSPMNVKVLKTCCNCNQTDERKEYKQFEEIEKKLIKDLEDAREKLEKYESYERICQRQKDEIMLLKKKLVSANQQLLNCNITKEEMLRQNKLFEDNNNKSMAELEEIVAQLEEMQSSLTKLKTECETKSQSLESISVELASMKRSRRQDCEESKQVLNCVRMWIRQQKHMINALQDKLCERQQQLMCISSEKKKLLITIKRLVRENKILTKGFKFIRRQMANKRAGGAECKLPARQIHSSHYQQKDGLRNGYRSIHLNNKQSNAIYSHFKRECGEKSSSPGNQIRIQGDYGLFSALEYLAEKVPRTSQVNENFEIETSTKDDRLDYGYQTSSSSK